MEKNIDDLIAELLEAIQAYRIKKEVLYNNCIRDAENRLAWARNHDEAIMAYKNTLIWIDHAKK